MKRWEIIGATLLTGFLLGLVIPGHAAQVCVIKAPRGSINAWISQGTGSPECRRILAEVKKAQRSGEEVIAVGDNVDVTIER